MALSAALRACHNRAKADIIAPIGLAPGSEYQLIFVTADSTTATKHADISTYNSVRDGGAPSPDTHRFRPRPGMRVGSTATVNANVNAPNVQVRTARTFRVYNTQGIRSVGVLHGLVFGQLAVSPILYDQSSASRAPQLRGQGPMRRGQA